MPSHLDVVFYCTLLTSVIISCIIFIFRCGIEKPLSWKFLVEDNRTSIKNPNGSAVLPNCIIVPVYKCKHCSFKSETQSALRNHIRTHVEYLMYKIYKCGDCKYMCKSHILLSKHNRTVHGYDASNTYTSPYQGVNFASSYKHHIERKPTVFRNANVGEIIYRCYRCRYRSKQISSIRVHVTNKHANFQVIQAFRCLRCKVNFETSKSLTCHIDDNHSKPQSTSDMRDVVFRCADCGQEYTEQLDDLHSTSSKTETYKCNDCNFETKCKYHLENHVKMHSAPSPKSDMYQSQFLQYLNM